MKGGLRRFNISLTTLYANSVYLWLLHQISVFMKKLAPIICTVTILFLSNGASGQNATQSHKDSLQVVVQKYYDLSLEIYKANSTVAVIDELFSLFTEDFVYVHPKYGGTYSRTDLYEGYVRNQKNGAYDGSIVDLRLNNLIAGFNAVATDRTYLKKSEGGELEEVDPGMTLFEFKDGKISKIFEYW